MNIDEAIVHADQVGAGLGQCAAQHRQLAAWLRELRIYQKLQAGLQPLTSTDHFPWRIEVPDQVGFWWIKHPKGVPFVYFIDQDALTDMLRYQHFYLDCLDISRMDAERWVNGGWQCCPVLGQ